MTDEVLDNDLDAAADRLADRLLAALSRKLAEPLIVDRHAAAAMLGYGSATTFMRDVAARKADGFPQPLPQDGHPRFLVKTLRLWAERLDAKPRRATRRY